MKITKFVNYALAAAVPVFLLLHQTAIQSSAKETSNDEQIIRISASTFEFKPSEITVKKGLPVTLELVSQDRHHGFKLPEFHLRADIKAGVVEKLRLVPDKAGTFTFFCDVFCGDGHEDMSGTLKVVE
jgi:cytochrome c oxidase subunit II